jgi:hypothetical protein
MSLYIIVYFSAPLYTNVLFNFYIWVLKGIRKREHPYELNLTTISSSN